MIRIAICDDNQEQLELIKSACDQYFLENSRYTAEVLSFDNPLAILEKIEKSGGCDVVLLDICMPGMSGMEVARAIRTRGEKTEIIFLTASPEFALEAYSVQAVHYLLKPVSQKQFEEAMDRALAKHATAPVKRMLVNGEESSVFSIEIRDILYVESFRNYRSIYTQKGIYNETKRSLSALQEELALRCPGQFISPYRGYIVNLDAVDSISVEGIILKNGVAIPIKSGSFRKLKDSFFEWTFSDGRR